MRGLAKHLHRFAEYEAFYSRGSQVMHSGTYRDHLKVQGGSKVALVPIRHAGDMSTMLRSVFIVALGSYSKIVTTFLSDESDKAREMYEQKWRPAFMGMPDVKFEYAT